MKESKDKYRDFVVKDMFKKTYLFKRNDHIPYSDDTTEIIAIVFPFVKMSFKSEFVLIFDSSLHDFIKQDFICQIYEIYGIRSDIHLLTYYLGYVKDNFDDLRWEEKFIVT